MIAEFLILGGIFGPVLSLAWAFRPDPPQARPASAAPAWEHPVPVVRAGDAELRRRVGIRLAERWQAEHGPKS